MSAFDALVSFIGGLGLLFTGIKSLSANMLQIGGRPLRRAVGAGGHNRLLIALVGVTAGALLQSSNGVTFILVSMVTAGLLPMLTAMPLLAWTNLGTAALVAVASFDLRLVSILALGVSGIWLYLDRDGGTRRRQALEVVLGVAMLFLGLEFIRTGTAGLHQGGVAVEIITMAGASRAGAFLLGGLATLLTQSSSMTTIIAVTAIQADLLPLDSAVLLVLGAGLGSGASVVLMGSSTRGSQRQLVLFQGLIKLLGVAVLLPALLIEDATGWPMLLRLVRRLADNPGRQIAWVYFLCQVAALAAYYLLARWIPGWLARAAPPLPAESLAQPMYIYEAALGDAETAMILAQKEQARVVAQLGPALETADATAALSVARLLGEIGRFLSAVVPASEGSHAGLPRNQLDRLVNLQARNEALRSLYETVHEIARLRAGLAPGDAVALADALSQGLGAVLMCLEDAVGSGTVEDVGLLKQISSDRSSTVDALRRRLIRAQDQELVFSLTSLFERSVWLVQRTAILLEAG